MDIDQHLDELRRRLARALIVTAFVTGAFLFYANNIYHYLALPLLNQLTRHTHMVAFSILSPILVPFKCALFAAIFVTVPYWLYELWGFVTPALYDRERKIAYLTLGLGFMLFYFGIIFAYHVILPIMFRFVMHTAPADVTVTPDIGYYLDFVLHLFLAFGLAFELPVFILLLVFSKIVSIKTLKEKRPYVLIAAFVVGMLLTPPDVISQFLLAVPLYVLYEIGLFLAKLVPQASAIRADTVS